MNPASQSVALPTAKERRRLREALSLSQEQVAEAMGVTRATVQAWESGRRSPKGRSRREAYARVLGVYEEPAAVPRTDAAGATDAAETPEKRLKPDPAAPAPEPAAPETTAEPTAAEAKAATGAAAEAGPPSGPVTTPQEAFDALYAYVAPDLAHQAYLLTGRRGLSREAVEHAFRHAWRRWPEVARDRDPAGWVRAAVHEYALSPWHCFRRRHRRPDAPPAEPDRRELLAALLALPSPYRRTVLLYDGLGLDLPETAAETEATTPAAGSRLLRAREVIGQRVPGLADAEALHGRLSALAAERPEGAALPAARTVRTGCERRTRVATRAVIGVTSALIGITAFTALTAPTRYIPVNAPGEVVDGVPVRGGPQKLGPEDKKLRDKLRRNPNPGPERLVPRAE